MGRLSRTAIITAATLFLETSAYFLLFGIAAGALGLSGAGLSFGLAFLALAWAFILSLYVQTLKFTANLRGVLGLAVSIGSFLFLLSMDSGFSPANLAAVVNGNALSAVDLALSVVFLIVLWWRGSSLAQDQVGLDVVRGSFQLSVGALVAALVVEALGPLELVNGTLAVGIFAVGLSGMALSRFSSELYGSQRMSLDWLIPIGVSVAVVLLLGLLVAGAGLGGLDDATREILRSIGTAGGLILQPLILVIGILAGLLANLVSWISAAFGGGDISSFDRAVGRIEQFQENLREEAGEGGPPRFLIGALRWSAFLVGVTLAGWVVYRLFRLRGGWRAPGGAEETRESLFSWNKVNEDLGAALREWWQNLGGSRFKGRGRILEPSTPREFYHELLSAAEVLGQPRLPWQTPREHQWDLSGMMPDHCVAGIIDGFHRSWYGDMEAGQAEIESLRQDWQGIKDYLAEQQRLERERARQDRGKPAA